MENYRRAHKCAENTNKRAKINFCFRPPEKIFELSATSIFTVLAQKFKLEKIYTNQAILAEKFKLDIFTRKIVRKIGIFFRF